MTSLIQRYPLLSNISHLTPLVTVGDWFNNLKTHSLSMELENAPEIKINLTENDKSYTVRAQIPGAKKEDVKVQIDGNRVSISAETREQKEEKVSGTVICSEYYEGSSYRSFTLDSDVDETQAQAKFENGVLALTLPKKNGCAGKQIEIK